VVLWRGQEGGVLETTASWVGATLARIMAPISFRTWEHTWRPSRAGKHVIAVRATDGKGHVQLDAPVWNRAATCGTGSSARNWSSAPQLSGTQ